MIKKLSHNEFIEKLLERNEHYKKGKFEVIGKYINGATTILIKDKYGYLRVFPNNLLKGSTTSIMTAVFKQNYFIEKLRDVNKKYYKRNFKLIGNYKGTGYKIMLKGEFGYHLMSPTSLLKGNKLDIRNTTDENLYIINKSKSIHGDTYDYSKLEYKSQIEKSIITCPKHGEFLQIIKDHLDGEGCFKCGRERSTKYIKNNPTGWSYLNWEKAAKKSKNFHYFKVYITKCYNDNENFYKIGRTFLTLKQRFKLIPYNYEKINIFKFDTANEACIFEQELKNKNINSKYNPKINFNGMEECFNNIINL